MNNRQLFLSHLAQTSPTPMLMEVDSTKGMYMYLSNGQKIMDLISGINVSLLGHCHPRVVDAVKRQSGQYMHTMVYGEFVLKPQVDLANQLLSVLPDGLEAFYFFNSGSEAIEAAMKVAKKYTGRYNVISAASSYHGSTQGSASLMDAEVYTNSFRPLLPNIKYIQFNREKDLLRIDESTACVVIEPIQGEAGLIVPKNEYLQKLRHRCSEMGALLIFDEIQSGIGRTGYWLASEQYQVQADMVVLAKGLGGGMPIGAVCSSREIMSTIANPPLSHITTFGGHPVICAAACATIQACKEEKLLDLVAGKEELFMAMLPHRCIKEIRHAGLWFALEVENWEFLWKCVQQGIQEGIFFDWFLFNNHSIRISPPLIISEEEIVKACEMLHRVFDRCS